METPYILTTACPDKQGIVAAISGLGGKRGNDVVRLEADDIHRRDGKRVENLADEAHLLTENVGG